MRDPYLEKLLDIQSEIEGVDMRLSALEHGFALDGEEVDAFVKENRSLRVAKYEDFLSKEELNRIVDEYKESLNKGVECDAWDYGLSALIGVFCGIIDALFCSSPHEGMLSGKVDGLFEDAVKKFARFTDWNPREGKEDSLASAIGHLERLFTVGYDQRTSKEVNDVIKNMAPNNHHAKSAGHYFDIVGLLISICDQFNYNATFYDKNKGTIRIVEATSHDLDWAEKILDKTTFVIKNKKTGEKSKYKIKLQGNTFVSKIVAGTLNWFGHCISDMAGSSGSQGTGAGLPVPFTEMFQLCNFGRFPNEKGQYQNFATVMTKVYENGYDMRHAATTAIPVILDDILIRMLYVIKIFFINEKDWKDCIPKDDNPELHRMLTTGIGSMCLVDFAHAGITSCGNWVSFFTKLNISAWARFGQLGIQELELCANRELSNIEAIQDQISEDWNLLLARSKDLIE